MDNEEIFLMREDIEKKFEIHLKSGYDMRMYLYYPQSLLSDKIRAYLDELLLNEAYKCIDDAKFNVEKFTVYKDEISTIELEDKQQRVDMLENLINYFLPKEEYEKCSKIQKLLNSIK
jgi:hypothetical protein